MLVLEALVGYYRTIEFHLLQHYWLGHRLRVLEWFALEMSRDLLSFLRLHSSTAFQTLFVDYEDCSISSKGFLPTVVHIMVT